MNAPGSLPRHNLADYQPPTYLVDAVALDVVIHGNDCEVTNRLQFRRNPAARHSDTLWLDGRQLELVSIQLDGQALPDTRIQLHPEGLQLLQPPAAGELQIVTRLHANDNASMEGLYRSGAVLCTQCEAHGFSRITYFPDRPDVLACYQVYLEADKAEYPYLLANGNCSGRGELAAGRHWVAWDDPFPKPCYLFALVAGKLDCLDTLHRRPDGSEVAVKLYVEPGYAERAGFALGAITRAMQWDEQAYGLACDLDEYKVVAVQDFNMGAMENKGLNLFNARYVLGDPLTATDDDFAAIEAVIGHEYFHNWTGNRVTCRDWFQLSLKEGLTVFREQQFCAAQGSAAVRRIDTVRNLRARQFPEDAGPLAHPVQPQSYVEINNFYTATVYEKGAEVVGMLHTLLGPECFTRGVQRYLRDNDGRAATIEDWLQAHASESGRDLAQFQRWYHQTGTPTVTIVEHHDPASGSVQLQLTQTQAELEEQGASTQPPLHIPLRIALFAEDGRCLHEALIELTQAQQTVNIDGVDSAYVLSANRGFSAPIHCRMRQSRSALQRLVSAEGDAYARWQAMQTLFTRAILAEYHLSTATAEDTNACLDACMAVLAHAPVDAALTAELLRLPSLATLAAGIDALNPLRLVQARRNLQRVLATDAALLQHWAMLARKQEQPYAYNTADAATRRLRALALENYCLGAGVAGHSMALDLYAKADNLTDRHAAIGALRHTDSPALHSVLQQLLQQAGDDALLLDKWFALQAQLTFGNCHQRVAELLQHAHFNWRNPNRLRSVLGGYALQNIAGFHADEGANYAEYVGWLLRVEQSNPQVAARLSQALVNWRKLDNPWRDAMHSALQALAAKATSKDLSEVCSRAL